MLLLVGECVVKESAGNAGQLHLSIGTRMPFELDHFFILTDVGAPEADLLKEFGLVEGEPNTHPGQGTANRRFFLENAMLELGWVHSEAEATSDPAARLCVWDRWRNRTQGASPFGICIRPTGSGSDESPFQGWIYRASFFPEHLAPLMGDNSDRIDEPLLFCMVPGEPPSRPKQPSGLQKITALRIHGPHERPSEQLRAVGEVPGIEILQSEQPLLEVSFGGGRIQDFRPRLPLRFVW
jgi:hypothetical protein